MIVLDTNVVSEPLKTRPDDRVLSWLDAQDPATLHITTVTLAELLAGVAALPAGRRQRGLRAAIEDQVLPLFQGRILAFDVEAARHYAALWAAARAAGRAMPFADGAIAAIAKVHGYAVATRNVGDYAGVDVVVLNPWAAG